MYVISKAVILPVRVVLSAIYLLLVTGTAQAYDVYNRTDETAYVHSGTDTYLGLTDLGLGGDQVDSDSHYDCDYRTDSCTGESNDLLARNTQTTISIRIGEKFSCSVKVLGGGWVELVEKDRSPLKVLESEPNGYLCESFANIDAGNCQPGIDPQLLFGRDGCVGLPMLSLWPDRDSATDPAASFPVTHDLVDYAPYTAPEQLRNVKFLATGDPQYHRDKSGWATKSDNVIDTMKKWLLDRENRGALILGDLTQNGANKEFGWYREAIWGQHSNQFYEGLGNHDRPCIEPCSEVGGFGADKRSLGWLCGANALGNVIGQIEAFVYEHTEPVINYKLDLCPRNAFYPRTTPKTRGANPHYSWDWHDIHFVQLNVFPGDGEPTDAPEGNRIDPMNALSFLQQDLDAHAPVVNGQGKPVVLLHHYPPASTNGWGNYSKAAYWNAIRDHNVIAIIVGHAHLDVTSGRGAWASPWTMPTGAVERAWPFDNHIWVFNVSAARGNDNDNVGNQPGVFSHFEINDQNQMLVNSYGAFALSGGITAPIHANGVVDFCSPFPGSSLPTTWRVPADLNLPTRSLPEVPTPAEVEELIESEFAFCGEEPAGPRDVSCTSTGSSVHTDTTFTFDCSANGLEVKSIEVISPWEDGDSDGISDSIEASVACLDPANDDSDNDGLKDGVEDSNGNGVTDAGETNACNGDSDNDGLPDGVEDANQNGEVDDGETNPLDAYSSDDGLADGVAVPGTVWNNYPLTGTHFAKVANTFNSRHPDGSLKKSADDFYVPVGTACEVTTVRATLLDKTLKKDVALEIREDSDGTPDGPSVVYLSNYTYGDPIVRPITVDREGTQNYEGYLEYEYAPDPGTILGAGRHWLAIFANHETGGSDDVTWVNAQASPGGMDGEAQFFEGFYSSQTPWGPYPWTDGSQQNLAFAIDGSCYCTAHSGCDDDNPATADFCDSQACFHIPLTQDSDNDNLPDVVEMAQGDPAIYDVGLDTDPNEADTDGDGRDDGEEDTNLNGIVDAGETDPRVADTYTGTPGNVLNNYAPIGTYLAESSDYTPLGGATGVRQSADDFVVPAGQACDLTEIRATLDDPTTVPDARLEIYSDAGGNPGYAAPILTRDHQSSRPIFVDMDGSENFVQYSEYQFDTSTLTLGAGRYWVSVFGQMESGSLGGTRWVNSQLSPVESDAEAYFREVGFAWVPFTDYGQEPQNLAFAIDGSCYCTAPIGCDDNNPATADFCTNQACVNISFSLDSDNDGLTDVEEMSQGDPAVYDAGLDTDPDNEDTDGDGVNDGVEANDPYSSDPLNADIYRGDGDANEDTSINAGDIVICTRVALGQESQTDQYEFHCDAAPADAEGVPQPDGVIGAGDVLRIQQKALGITAP